MNPNNETLIGALNRLRQMIEGWRREKQHG